MRVALAPDEAIRKLFFFRDLKRVFISLASLHEFRERVFGQLIRVCFAIAFDLLCRLFHDLHVGHACVLNHSLQ